MRPVVGGVEHNGVQSQSAVARHPAGTMRMIEQTAHQATMSRPHREFRKARPALRRNRVRWALRVGRAQSARCSSRKRRCRREIEWWPAVDWSSSFRNRRSNATMCPNSSVSTPRCGVGRRDRHRPSRKHCARGNRVHRLPIGLRWAFDRRMKAPLVVPTNKKKVSLFDVDMSHAVQDRAPGWSQFRAGISGNNSA